MKSDRTYEQLLILDLIDAEALRGRFYTMKKFAEKFAYMKSSDYKWPKGMELRHKKYIKELAEKELERMVESGEAVKMGIINGEEQYYIKSKF
jgi:hypothetical protein